LAEPGCVYNLAEAEPYTVFEPEHSAFIADSITTFFVNGEIDETTDWLPNNLSPVITVIVVDERHAWLEK
jgi:hypothetical protein